MNKSKWLLSRFHRYMLDRDQKMHKKGTLFCILSGGLIGLALAIMMPATTTLQTQSTQWGVSFWGWMIVLASVALLASVFSFLGTLKRHSIFSFRNGRPSPNVKCFR